MHTWTFVWITCFDQQYKPVFIDIDRAESPGELPSLLGSSESCMYDTTKSCIGNDWMQFGWMLAWILEPSTTGSYHERVFDDLPSQLKEDNLLRTLIVEGNLSYTFSPCRPVAEFSLAGKPSEEPPFFFSLRDASASIHRVLSKREQHSLSLNKMPAFTHGLSGGGEICRICRAGKE